MELSDQKGLLDKFVEWWESAGDGGLSIATTIEDNRRRYRMERSAAETARFNDDLSSLPSTKSRSIVDAAADAFLAEYHQEPDSISYSARLSPPVPSNVLSNDEMARWLTEIFHYRAEYTANFYQWHDASIRAGLVDGFEAAMVCWKRHTYEKKVGTKPVFKAFDGDYDIPPDLLPVAQAAAPDKISIVDVKQEVVVCDTWWVDQLIPGETVFWDWKIPMMDVNLGEFVLVKLYKTEDEVKALAARGIFDKYEDKDAESVKDSDTRDEGSYVARNTHYGDPRDVKDDDIGRLEVWAFFHKVNFEPMVCFSLKGEKELSGPKSVNDIYFGGRNVNRYPVVVGKTRSSVHEPGVGVGIPALIASHEDEWNNNRNDIQDAARQALMNKWRVSKGADVDIDQLINKPAFYADMGEVERIDMRLDIMPAQRTGDMIGQDIAELVPTSLANRGRAIVPKGTNSTLGAVQMMEMDSLTKRNAQMKLRNETFLKPLLYLIAEAIFAYESDDMIARIAGRRAKIQPPEAMTQTGQTIVNFSLLDFPVDVSINAGLGNTPKYQKAQNLMQIAGWRKENQVPTDVLQIAQQLNTLAGFDREQFDTQPPPPPPPPVEYKANINIPVELLPPDAQMALLDKLVNGQMSVTATVDDKNLQKQLNLQKQNGGMGMPPDRSQMGVTDGMGPEAMAMSEGGMGG